MATAMKNLLPRSRLFAAKSFAAATRCNSTAAASPIRKTFEAFKPSSFSGGNSSSSSASASGASESGELELNHAADWTESMLSGMATKPFPKEVNEILLAPVNANDVAAKPAGGGEVVPYLPEIKYRGILNKAFGPGGWSLVPRGTPSRQANTVSREFALFALGRFVSQARGQQDLHRGKSVETALEGVKSNALMRCCKDLGIASELWDPVWIKGWKARQKPSSGGFTRR